MTVWRVYGHTEGVQMYNGIQIPPMLTAPPTCLPLM